MRYLSALTLVLSSSALAQLHDGDIVLTLSPSQQITTNALNEVGQPVPQRVFGSEFEPGLTFTNEPGFDSNDGLFEPQSQIGFLIRRALRTWTGSDFASPIPGERLSIRSGPLGPVLTPTTDTFVNGIPLSVNSVGSFHRHWSHTLLPAPDIAEPQSGIYLYEIELWSTQSGILNSQPFWVVFNFNASEEDHGEAIAWVNAHLVCPSDFNRDGVVDFFDYLDFVDLFSSGSAAADFNTDGVVDFFDYLDFVDQFAAGC